MNRFQLQQDIARFLAEDIAGGDITSQAIFSQEEMACARFIARQPGRAAGMAIAVDVFRAVNSKIACQHVLADGAEVKEGEVMLEVHGPVVALLAAERVALNLCQRLCGIATLTSRFVAAVSGLPVSILDTRKTTPGMRMLEKYAVRAGGGRNHRFALSDGILIKDNHIAAAGSISRAVELVRAEAPHTLKIEVEAETLDQVRECLACRADIIMLDNMPVDLMRQAVAMIDGQALVEASGGVRLDNVRNIAETGVDFISIGGLTHSAPAIDISMELATD